MKVCGRCGPLATSSTQLQSATPSERMTYT